MEMILDFAKTLLTPSLGNQGITVDFTMGNGHDTLFLAQHTKYGQVYAFDIQKEALERTKKLLDEHGVDHVRLILDSHSNFKQYFNAPIDAGIFNLGYLPNGDKSITTNADTSLSAVREAAELLSDRGILVIVLYPGHPQGKLESELIEEYCSGLDGSAFDVIKYDFINKNHPPYLLAIQRRQRLIKKTKQL